MEKTQGVWLSAAALGLSLAVSMVAVSASAQVPREMTVQGILYTTDGTPVEGSTTFIFTLSRSSTVLWTETQTPTLTGGLFTVSLGETTPIDPAFFSMTRVSLGVTVNGEMMEAIPLTTVAYAFRAHSAETADTYDGDVDWAQLTGLPAGFADGTDDGAAGTTYAAGDGLDLAANTFSAEYGGDGTATTLSRSDHTHAWSSLTAIPPGFADGVDDEGADWSTLTSIPPGFADGTDDVGDAWTGLTGVPPGFADGTDDVGGARGTVFTHWGRPDCPTGTSLVYAGFAAGAGHTQSGSGANTLCLTGTPTWDNFSDLNQNGGLLYGTEYEMSGYGLAGASPFNTLHDGNAPCAVCLDASADLEFMLPGSQTCPVGFNTRVQGYLMSTEYQQGESEFVCVDRMAQATSAARGNENGNLWYPVEGECGSLPCGAGQYVNDREITCAICTR